MADTEDKTKTEKKTLSLSTRKLGLKKPGDNAAQIRQSFSHGRSKAVEVEVKRKRITDQPHNKIPARKTTTPQGLSEIEWESRLKAVQQALKTASEDEALIQKEKEERTRFENLQLAELEQEKQRQAQEQAALLEQETKQEETTPTISEKSEEPAPSVDIFSAALTESTPKQPDFKVKNTAHLLDEEKEAESYQRAKRNLKSPVRKSGNNVEQGHHNIHQRLHGMSVKDLLNTNEENDQLRRYGSRRSKDRTRKKLVPSEQKQVTRDVIIPEIIAVQELANRMAIRGAEVIKKLMSMGVMVNVTQNIDADTAELIVTEFGHTPKRVSAADVELGIQGQQDQEADMFPRPPVVTVMGHVDHGKTSLLDAIRKTDVVMGEAGGITQHIGAYQVTLPNSDKITFIDTPGHAAFTDMRARGANVTDLVVLVVAADDGIMEQTIEAIHHARAANVPIIVAINKIDKPHANVDRVRQMLLQQDIVVEQLGGDIISVEVSAKTGQNIDKLEEAILLQAEIMELKANPHRSADGIVIEAKLERGRGSVATILVQRGTLKPGDIFVAGNQSGRVRALVNDKGKNLKEAFPAQPVEVIGFMGTPSPGDDFIVVESESRAREITEFRTERQKNKLSSLSGRGTFEQLLIQAQDNKKELTVVVKTDVQGTLEAILSSFQKLSTSEVTIKVLYGSVGGINESDIVLAKASNALIIGFNVRANPQARDLANQSNLEIRYYSIIYNIIDDVKAIMGGLLSPTLHERFLGNAEIRQVFNITKTGKIAGCYVTTGIVKRGAKVRLLRDNVVIHEGSLKTLKRIKDEVKEVREGYECGMAFENYQDIREKDIIECFEIEEIARVLA